MEEIKKEEHNTSRRDILKKAGKTAAFAVPTIMTFSIPSLAVEASGAFRNPRKNRVNLTDRPSTMD